jgi:hypothetical protein
MAHNESQNERGKVFWLTNVQNELFERYQEANKRWLDRAQAEASAASEFVSKLSSARSIPDAMTAYQDWGTRRFEMMADDAKHALDDTQKFWQSGTHMLTNGFASKNP